MAGAGVTLLHETVGKAAMGLRALLRAREVLSLLRSTRQHFIANRPSLLICVDSWAMNRHFAGLARKMRIPVLYYISPQVWASRPGRVRAMRRLVDHVACILPFEQQYLRDRGVKATFVGHPLFDELPRGATSRHGGTGHGLRNPLIGLVAGSRRAVAKQNGPRLVEVADRIRAVIPTAAFVSPTTSATHAIVQAAVGGREFIRVEQDAFDTVIPECDLCVTVSGTATLHIAAYNVPMVVVYYGNPLAWHLLGRWLIKTRTFALVNLLNEDRRHIVPEYVPWTGPVDGVVEEALSLLQRPDKAARQRDALARLVASLDRRGASEHTARLALGLM
jgi:lipid-A-disaccharide synthase